jgi:hypothetical protein
MCGAYLNHEDFERRLRLAPAERSSVEAQRR